MANQYLFALFLEALIVLLMFFGMLLWAGCRAYLVKFKAEETEKMVKGICEEVVGRMANTIGEEAKDLMDYAMDKTQEMVKKTFDNEDES